MAAIAGQHQRLKGSCQSSCQDATMQRAREYILFIDSGVWDPAEHFAVPGDAQAHNVLSSTSWKSPFVMISHVVPHDICKCSYYGIGSGCSRSMRSRCHVDSSLHPCHQTMCTRCKDTQEPGWSTQPQCHTRHSLGQSQSHINRSPCFFPLYVIWQLSCMDK